MTAARLRARVCREVDGVVLIEGTIGVVMLLLATLAAIQLLLVTHASLAAHVAAAHAARTYALTGNTNLAERAFEAQAGLTLRILTWEPPEFSRSGGHARAVARVHVPPIFPGAGLLGGNGLSGPVLVTEFGEYPVGGAG